MIAELKSLLQLGKRSESFDEEEMSPKNSATECDEVSPMDADAGEDDDGLDAELERLLQDDFEGDPASDAGSGEEEEGAAMSGEDAEEEAGGDFGLGVEEHGDAKHDEDAEEEAGGLPDEVEDLEDDRVEVVDCDGEAQPIDFETLSAEQVQKMVEDTAAFLQGQSMSDVMRILGVQSFGEASIISAPSVQDLHRGEPPEVTEGSSMAGLLRFCMTCKLLVWHKRSAQVPQLVAKSAVDVACYSCHCCRCCILLMFQWLLQHVACCCSLLAAGVRLAPSTAACLHGHATSTCRS
jgi:hypothetical protein